MFLCSEVSDLPWQSKALILPFGLSATGLAFSIIIILLNAFVLTTFKQKKELQKSSLILLLSMAIADLLTGLIFIPLWIVTVLLTLRHVTLERVCPLQSTSTNLVACLVFSSLYHLAFVAWERYIAIRKWRDYKIIKTKTRLQYLAILAWLAAVATTFPSLVMDVTGVDTTVIKRWTMFGNFCGAATIVAIIYLYVMVYLGIRKRKNREIGQATATVQKKLQSKIAKTTSLITASLLFTLFTAGVLFSLRVVFTAFRTDLLFKVLGILFQSNSVINPLVYCYRDRRFKKAVLEMLRIRKPHWRIKPTDGPGQSVRRQLGRAGKNANDQQYLTQDKNSSRSQRTRSPSCDVLLGRVRPCEIQMLKRSSSAPELVH